MANPESSDDKGKELPLIAAPAASDVPLRQASASGDEDEGFSLLDYVTNGTLSLPRDQRHQKAFFRFLKRAGSDPDLIDQVHRLRDAVILSTVRDKSHPGGLTIALTGLKGGEGTSLISLLLGLSLGECVHRRVAILDGRFNTQRFQALSDLLGLSKNSVRLQKGSNEVVGYYNDAHPNVYFLRNAGSERSMQFFSDKRLSFFLSDLRQQFDFTIIDLPPLVKETASVFVAPQVDRLYLVVEAGKARLAEVGVCLQTLRQAGGQLSGVILNKQKAPLWSKFLWREFFY